MEGVVCCNVGCVVAHVRSVTSPGVRIFACGGSRESFDQRSVARWKGRITDDFFSLVRPVRQMEDDNNHFRICLPEASTVWDSFTVWRNSFQNSGGGFPLTHQLKSSRMDFNATSKHLPTTGYWGAPTSTVDWCEHNYDRSFWVAEFFNTLSSLTMVIQGLIGLLLHRHMERRIHVCYGAVVLVGLGSTAFHGTLWFEHQMLDELPMLYGCLAFLYCFLEERGRKPRLGKVLPIGLVLCGVLLTVLVTTSRGYVSMMVFRSSYTAMAFTLLLMGMHKYYRASLRPNRTGDAPRSVFVYAAFCYLTGTVLWIIDNTFCTQLQSPHSSFGYPHLHSWWHVLASTGCVSLAGLLAYERQRSLLLLEPCEVSTDGKIALLEIRYFGFVVPYVVVNGNLVIDEKWKHD